MKRKCARLLTLHRRKARLRQKRMNNDENEWARKKYNGADEEGNARAPHISVDKNEEGK